MLLSQSLLKNYSNKTPDYKFGDLSKYVMQSKYSRLKEHVVEDLRFSDSEKEDWWEIVARNTEGIFRLMQKYMPKHRIKRSEMRSIARRMYDDIFTFKFLPAGRPLRNVGTYIIENKGLGASLNNCSFVSLKTGDIVKNFQFIFDYSMLGVGVGVHIGNTDHRIYKTKIRKQRFVIPDTREGLMEALGLLISSYLQTKQKKVVFDYSLIRKKGEKIKGMGGIHMGYEPFEEMYEDIREVLNTHKMLCTRALADISNIIGKAVVNGGQRRTALILLGDEDDNVFLDLKNIDRFPYRFEKKIAYTSNNSILKFISKTTDFEKLSKQITDNGNGEPAVIFMHNRKFGRMISPADYKDMMALGVNPCAEMFLENYEMCNLMEIDINLIETNRNPYDVIYNAVLYAKIVSHVPSHWIETKKVVGRNHRIGISLTGVIEYLSKVNGNLDDLASKLDRYYAYVKRADRHISRKLRTTESIRVTTIKPSGSLSLLMGTTAGVHASYSEYIIRRAETIKDGEFSKYYKKLGYNVVDSVYKKDVEVIEFPLKQEGIKTVAEQTIEEQFELVALMQKYWSDNSVSVSITYKEDEEDKIAGLLRKYENKIKSVSFNKYNNTFYDQLVLEPITKKKYGQLVLNIMDSKDAGLVEIDSDDSKFCTTDSCELKPKDL